MKRILTVIVALNCIGAFAQTGPQPQKEKMKPHMTERWGPIPPVVTPGDQATASAPSDAVILFDGKDLGAWKKFKSEEEAGWPVHDGVFTVDKSKGDIITKDSFGSFQMHIEWLIPADITGNGQFRGNSGIFIYNRYEVQILDSYENPTYVNGMAASIYKQTAPQVNAMRKPGEWNVYDIVFNAPVLNADGSYRVYPTITLIHNGVLVLNNVRINGTTEFIGLPRVDRQTEGPIKLQAHPDKSQPVSFRNIWIRRI